MLPNSFTPLTSNTLLAAQILTRFKGQEIQNEISSEEEERKRVDTLVLKQVESNQAQSKTQNMQKGILA